MMAHKDDGEKSITISFAREIPDLVFLLYIQTCLHAWRGGRKIRKK